MSKHKKHEKKVVKKDHLEPAEIPETNTVLPVDAETTEETNNFANETTKKAKDMAHDAEEKIDEISKDAKKFADNASKKAKEFAHDAEVKIDEVTQKAKAYVEGQGKKDFQELENETITKVNAVAEGVEHLGEGYEDLIESIFPSDHAGSRIVYNAERNENVDRWVVVRMLWCIVLWPVIAIWGAWIALIRIVYMVKIISTGKRDRMLWNKMIRFANYVLNRDAYIGGLIDRRPEIVE